MKKIKRLIHSDRFRFRFTKEHILERLQKMETLTSMYASQASSANIGTLRFTYQDMSVMYLKRYQWYLAKLMNGEFDKG